MMALRKIMNWQNLNHLSHFVTTDLTLPSTKILQSTLTLRSAHKFTLFRLERRYFHSANTRHIWFVTSPSICFSTKMTKSSIGLPLNKFSLLQLNCRSLPTEIAKSKISILTQSDDQERQKQEEEDKKRKEDRQTQWKRMKLGFIIFGSFLSVLGSVAFYELSKPSYDESGNLIEDEFTNLPFIQQRIKRFFKELMYFKKMVQEPSREKLLPDPLKFPYIQPPYTVVLEMKDVLVHPDWTYQTGWRFKKRPGVDQFLEAIAPPKFETVVYTAEHGMTVFPILDILDPRNYILFRLVRDATRFVDGHHVKDLDALNRDLSKVIVIDWNSDSVKFHSDNMLKIPRWSGNDDDTTLYDLAAFLQTIHATGVEDVRDVLKYYKQFDNPLEVFRNNQRKLLEQIEEEETKAQLQQQSKFTSASWKPSFLKNKLI